MRTRELGRCSHPHSSTGKGILLRNEFMSWCYRNENYDIFIGIYNNWKENNFIHKLSPSIDRINNNIGYYQSNIQWLTLSDNSSKK